MRTMKTQRPRQSGQSKHPSPSRRVCFLALPQTVLLDLAGPWDIFHQANEMSDKVKPRYQLEIISLDHLSEVPSHSGLLLGPTRSISKCRGTIDTLIIPATIDPDDAPPDARVVRHVERLAAKSRRVASVCGGAFLLGAAGLLEGRRATTHWRCLDLLEQMFPSTKVERDMIYVKDGPIYTSAGVTAGMDLTLALIEEDYGRETAFSIARQLVMFARRPGGQAQFSELLKAQSSTSTPITELVTWIHEHLRSDLSVEALAKRVCMSPRHFARVFAQEVGTPPARYVEKSRVETVRHCLEANETDLKTLAAKCGFGNADGLRRAFVRHFRVSPAVYRERFKGGWKAQGRAHSNR
jgi:transcriptional regulator GlxA family with amidase domain